jgi:uncharacterized protein (DUF58 family)
VGNFINRKPALRAVAKSTVWIVGIGAAVAIILAVAYMPDVFLPRPESVPQLQTGGQVKSTLQVGEVGFFRGLVSGGKPPYQVEWAFPDGSIVRSMNTTRAFDSPGSYEVTVSISDSAGQSKSHSFEVRVVPAQ